MQREARDVAHAAAGMHIKFAVPGKERPLRIDGEALVQRVKLQTERLPEQRLASVRTGAEESMQPD